MFLWYSRARQSLHARPVVIWCKMFLWYSKPSDATVWQVLWFDAKCFYDTVQDDQIAVLASCDLMQNVSMIQLPCWYVLSARSCDLMQNVSMIQSVVRGVCRDHVVIWCKMFLWYSITKKHTARKRLWFDAKCFYDTVAAELDQIAQSLWFDAKCFYDTVNKPHLEQWHGCDLMQNVSMIQFQFLS